ncbi:hypothetical protein HBZS_120280 [Helicobacter bizzozeronii CCUG 35545]|nr:hypothetical protein HBZS_120280 [Helicobacter bizzozeronii CCUG 35545]
MGQIGVKNQGQKKSPKPPGWRAGSNYYQKKGKRATTLLRRKNNNKNASTL